MAHGYLFQRFFLEEFASIPRVEGSSTGTDWQCDESDPQRPLLDGWTLPQLWPIVIICIYIVLYIYIIIIKYYQEHIYFINILT